MCPGQSTQARDGWPTSLTRFRSQPFCVTYAGPGPRQPCTQRNWPERFNTCCADAPGPAKAAITVASINNPDFMAQPFLPTTCKKAKRSTSHIDPNQKTTNVCFGSEADIQSVCRLFPQKRTSTGTHRMSALCQKQASRGLHSQGMGVVTQPS
jgi:hypothetical protein